MSDPTPNLTQVQHRGLRLVARVTDISYRHRLWFLAASFALTAGAVVLASQLEVRSSFAELLPTDLPSVANLNELIRRVGGDGSILVSIETTSNAPAPDALAAAEAWVPRLAAELRALGPEQIRSIEESSHETELWYQNHWPLFVSVTDLTRARDALAAEVHRRKARANPLDFDLSDGEPTAPSALPGDIAPWLDTAQPLPREQVAKRFTQRDGGFYVHPDGRSVTFIIRPAGTSLGVSESRALLGRVHALIDRHQAELDHQGLRVGLSGTFPQAVAEYDAILHDIASTALLVVVLVLAALLLFFRELRSVVVLMASVLVAVAITFGLTRLAIGYLNTQTAFLGAIVVGNGINYGLIYLARVRQLRVKGVSLRTALHDSALVTARATLLAAAASSVSFAVLAVAGNRGFRHFGFIGGLGMLLCWLFTFLLLPALLGVVEGLWPDRSLRPKVPAASGPSAPWVPGTPIDRRRYPRLRRLFARPRELAFVILLLALVSLVSFLIRLPHAMETNLENLSNQISDRENGQLVRDNRRANASLGRSIAGTLVLLPSADAAEEYCRVVRERARDPKVAAVVDSCDTLTMVVPDHQPQKLALIHDLASRLSDALLASLPSGQAERLRAVRADLVAQTPVTLADAPRTLTDRFRERDGTVGHMAVITAKPNAYLEISANLITFATAVRNVPVQGRTWDATGEQVILADLLEDIDREGPRTTALSFAGVCVLVLLFFSQWRRRLEVLLALLSGVAIMAGVATSLGLKINFFNFIVFPVTFGIAVDYGANISARIRARGGDVLRALHEVGPAVALCSLTSVIGYATLLISINRALRSFGWYAIAGEVASLFTALLLLPALALGWEQWHRHSAAPLEEKGV